jgi:hypothetical protein
VRKRGGTAALAHRRDVVPVPELGFRSWKASDIGFPGWKASDIGFPSWKASDSGTGEHAAQ